MKVLCELHITTGMFTVVIIISSWELFSFEPHLEGGKTVDLAEGNREETKSTVARRKRMRKQGSVGDKKQIYLAPIGIKKIEAK